MSPPPIRELPEPRAILLVRLSAIGDIVMASGLPTALRHRYPAARIEWLVQSELAPLVRHHPGLDGVIAWPRRHWAELRKAGHYRIWFDEISQFRSALKKPRFDWALDLQGLLKSGVLTGMSQAPVRIGLGSREGSAWLMTHVEPRAGDPRVFASEYRYLAERLGLAADEMAPRVGIPETDRQGWAAQRQQGQKGQKEDLAGSYWVLCPFTTRPQKHWFLAEWRSLMTQLGARWGRSMVILGGPGDRDAAAILAEGMPQVVNLAGQTSLTQAAAVIEQAAGVIGVDTGLSHMGLAFQRPTVLLFGATRPYLETGLPQARVLYHRRPCSPCRRRPTCGGAYSCMAAITPGEVLKTLDLAVAAA
ncbi:MAG: glycosyltransferase family 9 protein [Pseudomonadota bacterium]